MNEIKNKNKQNQAILHTQQEKTYLSHRKISQSHIVQILHITWPYHPFPIHLCQTKFSTLLTRLYSPSPHHNTTNFVRVLFWNRALRISGVSANVHTCARYQMHPCRLQTICPGQIASSSIGFVTATLIFLDLITLIVEIFSFLRWFYIINI